VIIGAFYIGKCIVKEYDVIERDIKPQIIIEMVEMDVVFQEGIPITIRVFAV
jgi:hypothetical protein